MMIRANLLQMITQMAVLTILPLNSKANIERTKESKRKKIEEIRIKIERGEEGEIKKGRSL